MSSLSAVGLFFVRGFSAVGLVVIGSLPIVGFSAVSRFVRFGVFIVGSRRDVTDMAGTRQGCGRGANRCEYDEGGRTHVGFEM
jgi:hypothetical protein